MQPLFQKNVRRDTTFCAVSFMVDSQFLAFGQNPLSLGEKSGIKLRFSCAKPQIPGKLLTKMSLWGIIKMYAYVYMPPKPGRNGTL